MRIVIDLLPELAPIGRRSIRVHGAVTAKESHVLYHGFCTGHPFESHGTRIDAVGVHADSSDNIGPALGSLEQRFRPADILEARCSVCEKDSRGARMQADENCVGL